MKKFLLISHLEHEANDWVRNEINFLVGPQEPLLATVKRRKLAWFGYVSRHDSLSKTIPQGTLEGGRRRGRQKKQFQRVDIPAHARTAHKGFLQKRLEEDLC